MTHRPESTADDRAARPVARARIGLPAVDRAIADLAEAAELVPFLALLRDPAASRPWREATLTAQARAERDYEARAELADRNEDAPGEHADAARADVLDLLADVLDHAVFLATFVSRAAWCPIQRPPGRDADPRPYLRRAAEYLPLAVTGWTNGKDIAHYVADVAAALVADLHHGLALVADGHTVKAVCPWCKGRTETAPIGGEYTWRVRVLPGGEPAIVCESGTCHPSSKEVGTWWGGCPVWPMQDWPWLARRLAHLDARRAAQAPPTAPAARTEGATGRAGTPTLDDEPRRLLAGLVDESAWPESAV